MFQFDETTIANANSIHDKLYRGFLKNKIEFSCFLSTFFNINISSNDLVEVSSNFVTDKFEKNKNYIIPKIIPILLYTGVRPWKPPSSLSNEYFKINYKFIDINTFSVDSLLNMNSAISFAMAVDKCVTEEECLEYINKLIKCDISNIDSKNLKMLFKYIALNFKNYDITNIL